MDDNYCDVLHNSFGAEKLNKLTLFLLIGSYSDFVRFKRRSVMNWLHCCLPMASIWHKIVTAVGPAISLVSITIRSSLSSRKGLPKSSIVVTRDFMSLKNDTWELLCTSWWSAPWTSTSVVIEASNSLTSLAVSGPDIIHRRRALGFSVRPTAPPSPLTIPLFCSCAWQIAIAENRLGDLWTVKNPFSNWRKTPGAVCWSALVSRRWTWSQRA